MEHTKRIAARLADDLFTNSANQHGDRLVMTDANGRDLGGWAEKPLADRIARMLEEWGYEIVKKD